MSFGCACPVHPLSLKYLPPSVHNVDDRKIFLNRCPTPEYFMQVLALSRLVERERI
jgi:hypothetical protein